MNKILVIDDEPDQIFTVKDALESYNDEYEVIGIESGVKGIEYLKNNELPDLILLDIMMPDMNGWQVFKLIKEIPSCKNIPIIFLTARTDVNARKAGIFLAEDYIEKPYRIIELKERIDNILKKR